MQERLSRRLWVRQLLALVGKEFQQIVRDPSSYLVAGVLPLLFLLLFGYGITLDAGVLQLAVFNQSGGQHSRALLTDFAHSPHFVIRSISHMREGERLMRESSVQGILVLGQQSTPSWIGARRRTCSSSWTEPSPTWPASSRAMRRPCCCAGRGPGRLAGCRRPAR